MACSRVGGGFTGSWVKTMPPVVDALLEVLQKDDFALVRDRAADALANLGDDQRAVPVFVKALCAAHRDVRFHAAQALMMGKAVSSLPLLDAESPDNSAPGEPDEVP